MGFFFKLQRSNSLLSALPRFSGSCPTPAVPSSLRHGSSFFTRSGPPRAQPPSSEVPFTFIYGCQVVIPGMRPFQDGKTRSMAEGVVEAIKHYQAHNATIKKYDRYDLSCSGISNGGSCKMQGWRNFDHESPSWTVRLEGSGWRVFLLDCPDASAGRLPKVAVSPESLHFLETDAQSATVNAHEVGHTMASHGAEMLVQDLCVAIHQIQLVERFCWTGFFSSMLPKVEMIVKDHRLVMRVPIPPPYVVVGVFCSLLAIAFTCF